MNRHGRPGWPEYAADAARVFRRGVAKSSAGGGGTYERLLAIVEGAHDLSDGSPELSSYASDWPGVLHLGARRANLLRPLATLLTGEVLEVGAECGALTRFLGERAARVVALEPDPERAAVAAARCRDLKTVSVACDTLDGFPSAERFDAVVLAGALEDAGRLWSGDGAEDAILKNACARLKPGGCAILSVENPLGLRHFAGYPDPRTGRAMAGIEEARGGSARASLVARLARAGFGDVELFLPLPDDKVPVSVLAPEALGDERFRPLVASLAASSAESDPRAPALQLFSLASAWKGVAASGLLPDLANAFLFVAWRGAAPPARRTRGLLASHWSVERRPAYRTATEIVREGDGGRVQRSRLRPADRPAADAVVRLALADEPLVTGSLLSEEIVEATRQAGWTAESAVPLFSEWLRCVAGEAGHATLASGDVLPGRFLDATPFNTVRTPSGALRLIDLEWEAEGGVACGWLVFRSVFHSFSRLPHVAEPEASVPRRILDLALRIAGAIGVPLDAEDAGRWAVREAALVSTVVEVEAAHVESAIRTKELRTRPDVARLAAGAEQLAAAEVQLAAAEVQLAAAEARLAAAEVQRAAREEALAELRTKVDGLSADLAVARAAADEEAAARRHAEVEREALVLRVAALAAGADESARRMAALDASLAGARREADDRARRILQLDAALAKSAGALDWYREERERLRAEAAKGEELRRDLGARAAAGAAAAESARRAVEGERDALAAARAASEAERDALAGERDALERALAERTQALEEERRRAAALAAEVRRRAEDEARRHEPRAVLSRARRRARFAARALSSRLRRDRRAIAASGLFDAAYYLETNPDVASAGLDPLLHFVVAGFREGRNPHPLFHTAYYLEGNPDVVASGANPLAHFVLSGAFEGRRPHRAFDPAFYRDTNADVRDAGANPLAHFVSAGWREGRAPSAAFDLGACLAAHPEFAADRRSFLEFLAANPEFHAPPAPPEAEPSAPEPAALAPAPPAPPEPEAPPPAPEPAKDEPERCLFDEEYYLATNPDVARSGVDPFDHYMRAGWRERRDPHPLFSTSFYVSGGPPDENPLAHFVREGAAAGRDPHPLFDTRFYLETYPDARGTNALVHYLERGGPEGRAPNAWFDGALYRRLYDDVGDADPFVHFARFGWGAGRHASAGGSEAASEEDYRTLRRLVYERQRGELEAYRPPAIGLVDIPDDAVEACARAVAFDAPENPVVSIVVPVHGNVRRTVECLVSLQDAKEGIPFEVIVADDASPDATREVLALVPGIRVVRADENLGFVKNANAGARAARGEFLVFLNNDAQVTPGWLRAMLAAFDEHADAGAVGAKVLFPDGRLQEAGCRILPDGTTRFIGVLEDPSQPRFSTVRRVAYCSGACLMVRRADFERLGGFDEAFAPAYFEDVDLCLRLRSEGREVYCAGGAVVVHHLGATMSLLPQGEKARLVARNRQRLLERHWERIRELEDARVVAFYLPQFHPTAENDRWWGKGFTEWKNVARARPVWEGHDQPRVPADLGFYDLRLDDVVREQWRLARRYGVSAFCYYYYWFGGKRLLDDPIERLLTMEGPKLPYCLAWANENWTRAWDGGSEHVLIAQEHSPEDDRAVIRDLMRFFRDPDYLRVGGRPVFLVYRHDLFPDVRATLATWRDECASAGIDPYLVACEACDLAFGDGDPRALGFDAASEFPPHQAGVPTRPPGRMLNGAFHGAVFDYRAAALRFATRRAPEHPRFRAVFPRWDNTPRRPDSSHVFAFSSPGTYRAWLETSLEQSRDELFGDERLVFVNAWNEWAEGCYLEPDATTGHAYLEATRAARTPGREKP